MKAKPFGKHCYSRWRAEVGPELPPGEAPPLSFASSEASWPKLSADNPEIWSKWGDEKSPRKHMAKPGIMPQAAKQYFGIFTTNPPSSPAPTVDPLLTESESCNAHMRPTCGQTRLLLLWSCSTCDVRVAHLADNPPAQPHPLWKSDLLQLRGSGCKPSQAKQVFIF